MEEVQQMVSDRLDEIQINLPNGFHDAEIKSFVINYVERTLVFDLMLWVGDLESSNEAEREAYVRGVLTISGFNFCVIESPDSQYPYTAGKPIRIDSGPGLPPHVSFSADPPADAFDHWFFVQDWNSFIYFRARDAHLETPGCRIDILRPFV
jgi:hypothetical protein